MTFLSSHVICLELLNYESQKRTFIRVGCKESVGDRNLEMGWNFDPLFALSVFLVFYRSLPPPPVFPFFPSRIASRDISEAGDLAPSHKVKNALMPIPLLLRLPSCDLLLAMDTFVCHRLPRWS